MLPIRWPFALLYQMDDEGEQPGTSGALMIPIRETVNPRRIGMNVGSRDSLRYTYWCRSGAGHPTRQMR